MKQDRSSLFHPWLSRLVLWGYAHEFSIMEDELCQFYTNNANYYFFFFFLTIQSLECQNVPFKILDKIYYYPTPGNRSEPGRGFLLSDLGTDENKLLFYMITCMHFCKNKCELFWCDEKLDWVAKYEQVLFLNPGKLGKLDWIIHTYQISWYMLNMKTYRIHYSGFLIIRIFGPTDSLHCKPVWVGHMIQNTTLISEHRPPDIIIIIGHNYALYVVVYFITIKLHIFSSITLCGSV